MSPLCSLFLHRSFLISADPNGAYAFVCLWQVSSAILEYYDGLLQKRQAKRNRDTVTRTLRASVDRHI